MYQLFMKFSYKQLDWIHYLQLLKFNFYRLSSSYSPIYSWGFDIKNDSMDLSFVIIILDSKASRSFLSLFFPESPKK